MTYNPSTETLNVTNLNVTTNSIVGGTLTVNGTGSSFTNELSVGDYLSADTLTAINGINGGSLSVSNNISAGADLTLGGGITSPFIICNDAQVYTLQYSLLQQNQSATINVSLLI